jgi:hypothetical protein
MKLMVESLKVTNLYDNFLIQNVLKQGDALVPLLFNFALNLP